MHKQRTSHPIQWAMLLILLWLAALACPRRNVGEVSAEQPAAPSGTLLIEKKVNEITPTTRQTVYVIPTASGKATVHETVDGDTSWLQSWHGKASCATYSRPTGGNSISLKITGSKVNSVYMDIDGDGVLDLMQDRTDFRAAGRRSYILVENRWTEVWLGNPGLPKIGDSATTVDEPEVTYVFKESAWVEK